MTQLEFCNTAADIPLTFTAKPRLARSGSCGWTHRGTVNVTVGGQTFRALLSVQLTIPRSKKWAKN